MYVVRIEARESTDTRVFMYMADAEQLFESGSARVAGNDAISAALFRVTDVGSPGEAVAAVNSNDMQRVLLMQLKTAELRRAQGMDI